MAAPVFQAWNGATAALDSPFAATTTGTSKKTMLQILPGTPKIRIIEWGYSFDAVPTAPVRVELVTTGAVGATVSSALTFNDITRYNDVTGPASSINISSCGYAFSAEGTVTSTRLIAEQYELGTQFKQQFPLGREPEVNGGQYLRIRALTTAAVGMTCYIIWEE